MTAAVPLLEVNDLSVSFRTVDGVAGVLDQVSFEVPEGHWTGLVGETGCGKSVTASAVIRLLPRNAAAAGQIALRGIDLMQKSEREMRSIRGRDIAMVFQDPGVAINPALKIGSQIAETIAVHNELGRHEARERAAAAVRRVDLDGRVLQQYAHELSGGMRQRVMIALALACNPSLILADEPTSSLDVTVQRDILALMKELSAVSRTAVLFITHDLVLVGQTCDELVVMYAGTIVERGPSQAVLRLKHHPYTRALVAAIPMIDARKTALDEIEGSVPSLMPRPAGCPFAPRCTSRIPGTCERVAPVERVVADGVRVRCHLYESAV
jgi:oligopeptide/dipeptide ABC transporter ATP-binding protein